MKPHGHGWSSLLCLLALFSISLAGCRSNNHGELVEMALRAREQDLRVLKEEVWRLQSDNCALQRELVVRQQGGWVPGGGPISPEYASQTFTLKRVTLGRGTGQRDDGAKPGESSLQVVIEPRDAADDIIKAPGKAHIVALEVSPEGLKTPISTWDIPPEQLFRNWQSGLFSNGYVLVLPWQQAPKTRQVRVLLRFQLSDGRVFEADRDITINAVPMIPPGPPMPPGPKLPLIPPDPKAPPISEPVWPGGVESLPIPKEKSQLNGPPADRNVQAVSHWHAPSLNGAVRLLQPVSLYGNGGPPPLPKE